MTGLPLRLVVGDTEAGDVVIVGPHDRVIIRVDPTTTDEQLQAFSDAIAEHWPDVAGRVVLVVAEQVAVLEPGEETP